MKNTLFFWIVVLTSLGCNQNNSFEELKSLNGKKLEMISADSEAFVWRKDKGMIYPELEPELEKLFIKAYETPIKLEVIENEMNPHIIEIYSLENSKKSVFALINTIDIKEMWNKNELKKGVFYYPKEKSYFRIEGQKFYWEIIDNDDIDQNAKFVFRIIN